jgi:hypothetical protein
MAFLHTISKTNLLADNIYEYQIRYLAEKAKQSVLSCMFNDYKRVTLDDKTNAIIKEIDDSRKTYDAFYCIFDGMLDSITTTIKADAEKHFDDYGKRHDDNFDYWFHEVVQNIIYEEDNGTYYHDTKGFIDIENLAFYLAFMNKRKIYTFDAEELITRFSSLSKDSHQDLVDLKNLFNRKKNKPGYFNKDTVSWESYKLMKLIAIDFKRAVKLMKLENTTDEKDSLVENNHKKT